MAYSEAHQSLSSMGGAWLRSGALACRLKDESILINKKSLDGGSFCLIGKYKFIIS